jgi:hypothetical protein
LVGDELPFINGDDCVLEFPTIDLRLARFAKVLDEVFGAASPNRCVRLKRCLEEYLATNSWEMQLGRFDFFAHNNSIFSIGLDSRPARQGWTFDHLRKGLALPEGKLVSDMSVAVFTGDGRSAAPIFQDSQNENCTVPLLVTEAEPNGAAILIPAREASWPDGGRFIGWEKWFPPARPAWDQRKPMGIWRGGTTQGNWEISNLKQKIRYNLCKFSQEHPDLVDAKLIALGQTTDDQLEKFLTQEDIYGRQYWMSEYDMLNYKYLIVIDGNSNPDRFPKFLESGSLVFRSYPIRGAETFTFRVKPWVHFIPFKEDYSDLAERIQWARDHDDEAQIIVKQAKEYITSVTTAFLHDDAVEYSAVLLSRLSKLLRNYINC